MSNWAAFMANSGGGKKAANSKPPARQTHVTQPSTEPPPLPTAARSSTPAEKHATVVLDIVDMRPRTHSDVAICTSSTPTVHTGSTSAWLEAAQLRAVQELGDLFRERCDALGGRKHFAHFETWLWAARGESSQLSEVVPPIPSPRPGSSARAELIRKLLLAGQSEAKATATCDALDARCASLLARAQQAAGSNATPSPRPRARLVDGDASVDMGQGGGSKGTGSGKKKRKRSDGERVAGGSEGPAQGQDEPRGGDGGEVRRVRLVCGEMAVWVTQHHLDKLRQLFAASRAASAATAGPVRAASSPAPSTGGADASQLSKRELKKQRKLQAAAAATGGDAAVAGGGAPTAVRLPGTSPSSGDDDAAFVDAAFGVLARLMCLQGGHDNAGGMQGACPPAVFDALRSDFGVTMECFASPVNARFPRFCSAAADVDGPFGSRGSFFAFQPQSGAFLANPPFEPGIVSQMARHMEALLDCADASGAVLLFVVVIPSWPDQPCWQALQGSAHCTATLRLPKSKHAYLDGGQHHGRRAVPLRLSNHDSSVFFLMSSQAHAMSPLNFNKERRLREAFTGGIKILGALHK